jgi:hypothetical protein
MPRRFLPLLAAIVGMTVTPALADQIVGDWCPPGGGRTLTVRNYDDVTFAGLPVKANVNRHHVDFTIPAGALGAGETFDAQQLSDEEIRVRIGTGAPEIWTPCKPVS